MDRSRVPLRDGVRSGRCRCTPSVTLAALVLLSATAWPAPRSRRVTVWVTSMPEKIPALAPVPSNSERVARISAARNEFESFQIVVSGHARDVRAAATPLTGPTPADVISDVRLYREELINITQPSSLDGMTGRLPDALIPQKDETAGELRNAFPFDVGWGESRAIWVDVFVPATATPGVYRGEVQVFFGKARATIPVELTVWDFALPSTSSLRSAFGLAYGALPAGHRIDPSDITGFASLRARYGQLGLDHRVTLSRHDDGRHGDFAHFEMFYGPLMRGTAPTRLQGAQLTAVEYLGPLTDTANMRRWADHYRAQGWFARLFQYTCDEPPHQGCDWAGIVARAGAAKAADPEFRTLVTTTVQEADRNNATTYLDLLVPIINAMDDKSGPFAGNQRALYDPFLASDPLNELWMYQACLSHGCGGPPDPYFTGWPSYMIDASAVRNRAMQWLLFRYGASGELYWDTTFAYFGDAWTSQWGFDGNGDGTLFYPGTPARIGGTTHIPVASIRLKMIREGMEDYEYLRLASQRDPIRTMNIANSLFPTAFSTEATPQALMNARKALAEVILAPATPPLP